MDGKVNYPAIFLFSFDLPDNKIANAIMVVEAITIAIAVTASNGSIATLPEINPPIPICIKPSNEDAVPAFFENGAMQSAAAFG